MPPLIFLIPDIGEVRQRKGVTMCLSLGQALSSRLCVSASLAGSELCHIPKAAPFS